MKQHHYKHGLSIITKPPLQLKDVTCSAHDFFSGDVDIQLVKDVQQYIWFTDQDHSLHALHVQHATSVQRILIEKDGTYVITQKDTTNHSIPLLFIEFLPCVQAQVTLCLQGDKKHSTYVAPQVCITVHQDAHATISSDVDKQHCMHLYMKAKVQQGAYLLVHTKVHHSAYASVEHIVDLVGMQAKTDIHTMSYAREHEIIDCYAASIHSHAQTFSDLQHKGVVASHAKTVARGLVQITQQASDSEGYQQQDLLVVGTHTEADAIPLLEIHNHQVKCSHGSTISSLDEQQLFYLMSRGMQRSEAQQMLIDAFLVDG
ncbi:MAG: SufB/SufD family protein [Candidatus Woesearchaeota archaeon]